MMIPSAYKLLEYLDDHYHKGHLPVIGWLACDLYEWKVTKSDKEHRKTILRERWYKIVRRDPYPHLDKT